MKTSSFLSLRIPQRKPAFQHLPHQTTADQVFEEDQFEAYRSLGEHIGEDALTDARVDRLFA